MDRPVEETMGSAMEEAAARLAEAGVDAPRLAAEVLLEEALQISRSRLLALSPREPIRPEQLQSFWRSVDRCADGEPLAYVVGHIEFYGLEFRVDPRVLIPRPETEHLVELAIQKAQKIESKSSLTIVDVGTGSGCIAVSLAKHLPQARLVATDISPDALALAEENARRHGVESRIEFVHSDLLAPIQKANGVVANLPYVTTGEWQALPPHIREHEPRTALDGGPEGLDAIRRLLGQAPQVVEPGGWVLLEIGATQGPAVIELARQAYPMAAVQLHRDYAGLARVVEIQLRDAHGDAMR